MELRLLFALFRRWFWLLFLGAIIGVGAGYYYSVSQPSVFRSTSKVMVMQPRESLTSDLTALTDAELAETFRNLLVVKPVLDATSERVGGRVSAGQISSSLIEGTQLLEVTVTDRDPQRAALIANTLGEVLIEYNDSLQTDRFSASEESLQGQIAQVEEQMAALRVEEGQRTELSEEDIATQKQTFEEEILTLSEQLVQLETDIVDLGSEKSTNSFSPVQRKIVDDKRTEMLLLQTQLSGAQDRFEQLVAGGGYEGELESQRTRVIGIVEEMADLEKAIVAITGSDAILQGGDGDAVEPLPALSPEESEALDELNTQWALLDAQLSGVRGRYEMLVANGAYEGELEAQRTRVMGLLEDITGLENEISDLTNTSETPEETEARQASLRNKRAELALLQLNLEFASLRYQQLANPNDLSGAAGNQDSQSGANMALYQQIYSSLLSNYEAVRLARMQGTPNVVQVELATPGAAVRPNEISNAILGAFVGLIVMGSIAFLVEYLDDTLKSPDDIEKVLGLPIVGFVSDLPELSGKAKNGEEVNGPYVSNYPRAPLGETFRILRTNLEFADVDNSLKTILVTSAGPGEGKTTIAANLAASFSQQQKEVVLLDCDLRRPKIHRTFNVANDVGLSDIFLGRSNMQDASFKYSENLTVVTSGSLPPNPAELLGSESMTRLLEDVEEMSDVVVIDSPPSIVTDAAILSAKVDGVILVVNPGKTHADDARAQLDQMQRAGARIVGVVLNRVPRRRGVYGYKYNYYRYYRYDYGYGHYLGDDGSGKNKKRANSKRRLFGLFGSNGKNKTPKQAET